MCGRAGGARRGRGEDAEPEVLLAQCVMAAGGAGQTREPSDNGWHARWLNVAAIVCAEDEAIAEAWEAFMRTVHRIKFESLRS